MLGQVAINTTATCCLGVPEAGLFNRLSITFVHVFWLLYYIYIASYHLLLLTILCRYFILNILLL